MTDERRSTAGGPRDDSGAESAPGVERELPVVTVEELAARAEELKNRLAAGESFAIHDEHGIVGTMRPLEPGERRMTELEREGIVRPGWQQRQRKLRELLDGMPVLHSEPERASLTEVLLRMREEETR